MYSTACRLGISEPLLKVMLAGVFNNPTTCIPEPLASSSSSSSSYSVFILCCPFSRDGWIYPIFSAIARTPSLHLSRLRAFFFFKPIFSVSSPLASSRSSSVVLAFSCHSLQDSEQPSKHYRHPSSAHVHTI